VRETVSQPATTTTTTTTTRAQPSRRFHRVLVDNTKMYTHAKQWRGNPRQTIKWRERNGTRQGL
jgi:hypothetical protein